MLPFIYPQTFYKLTKMYRDELEATKVLNDFLYNLIEKRRSALKGKETKSNSDVGNERNIVIDHVLLNEENFTVDEMRQHLLVFIGGYETIAMALSHAMLLLAIHPEHQEQLYKEIQKKIKSNDDLKSTEIVNSIEYLELVQKETFRLMPSVPMMLRDTLEDFEIEPGLIIPKDTKMLINIFALHRQPTVWGDDANEFKPERFLPENSEGRNPFAYIPFSSGPRICIAFKYSVISLKIAMIQLLLHYKFTTSMKMEDIKLKSYLSLKLCSPHMIKIEKR